MHRNLKFHMYKSPITSVFIQLVLNLLRHIFETGRCTTATLFNEQKRVTFILAIKNNEHDFFLNNGG